MDRVSKELLKVVPNICKMVKKRQNIGYKDVRERLNWINCDQNGKKTVKN